MKKPGLLKDKLHITASSQDFAHRRTVSFTMRRGVVLIAAVLLLAAAALCTYILIGALRTTDKLSGDADALRRQIEQQKSEIGQYEQQLIDMGSNQADSGQLGEGQ
jgi:cell division protein FtsL